jgi:hypothetical protein
MTESTDLIIKEPSILATTNEEPTAGSEQVVSGQRLAWDCGAKAWRYLSPKHCPAHLNPFDGKYVAQPPFQYKPVPNGDNGRVKNLLTDANGIRVNAEGRINMQCYPKAVEAFLRKMANPPPLPKGKKTRNWEATARTFNALVRHDQSFKQYFDDAGEPRLETVRAMWMQIMNLIFTQKDVQSRFMTQMRDKALEDPYGTLKEWSELAGRPPIQIGIQNNSDGGTQVGINIFQQEEEPRPEVLMIDTKGEDGSD